MRMHEYSNDLQKQQQSDGATLPNAFNIEGSAVYSKRLLNKEGKVIGGMDMLVTGYDNNVIPVSSLPIKGSIFSKTK